MFVRWCFRKMHAFEIIRIGDNLIDISNLKYMGTVTSKWTNTLVN